MSLQAQRGTSAGMVITRGPGDREQTLGVAQRLHVTLTNPTAADIVGVTLLVHGRRNGPRMSEIVQTGSGDAGTISRIVQLAVHIDAWNHATTDLTVNSFTAVTWIDLVAVTYQDGSSWRVSEAQTCRIQPDLYMPVDVVARTP